MQSISLRKVIACEGKPSETSLARALFGNVNDLGIGQPVALGSVRKQLGQITQPHIRLKMLIPKQLTVPNKSFDEPAIPFIYQVLTALRSLMTAADTIGIGRCDWEISDKIPDWVVWPEDAFKQGIFNPNGNSTHDEQVTTAIESLRKFLGQSLSAGDAFVTVLWISQFAGLGSEFSPDGNPVDLRIHQPPCAEESTSGCGTYRNNAGIVGVRRGVCMGITLAPHKDILTVGSERAPEFFHEIGHSVGLCHCNDDDKPNNVMHQTVVQPQLFEFQRQAFKKAARYLGCDVQT